MRWKVNKNPKEYESRIVERFLLLPVTLNNEKRWLETAKIEQRYIYTYTYDCGCANAEGMWIDYRFID